jgi:hypothetical protein
MRQPNRERSRESKRKERQQKMVCLTMDTKSVITTMLCAFVFVSIIIIIINVSNLGCCQYCLSNGCAPCPNKELISNVSTYVGHNANTCAGEWWDDCNKYKNAVGDTNTSCWEK